MPGRPGLKQSERGRVVRDRPALHAGLNVAVALVGERFDCTATVMIDRLVRAGLESMGLGEIGAIAESATIHPKTKKQDLEELARVLDRLLSATEVPGMQNELGGFPMAS
jgi:hypothetical protein